MHGHKSDQHNSICFNLLKFIFIYSMALLQQTHLLYKQSWSLP